MVAASLSGCSNPDAEYRAQQQAQFDRYEATGWVAPPEEIPMLTRNLKAEELAKMGGRASQDDINGHPGDDPNALREVKESFVAYYNMPFGAEGERDAWIRFMHALNDAERLRERSGARVLDADALATRALLDEVNRNQAEIERRIAIEKDRRSATDQ